MATMNSFKQYARGTRQQHTEETFKGGMFYTDTPLPEGALKTLVNFSISEDGMHLTPRPGLRAHKYSVVAGSDLTDAAWMTDKEYVVSDSKVCHEQDGKRYDQIVLTHLDTCVIMTVHEDGTQLFSDISTCFVNTPTSAEIHGLPVEDTSPIRQQVGTFAFNNSYMFFNQDKVLCYTKFDEDLQKYVIKTDEVPRELSPEEATLWGFNMLSENPYSFSNQTGGAFRLSGVALYEEDGETPVFSPRTNTKYTLEVFYTGDPSTEVVQIEWKDLSGGWNVLKTFRSTEDKTSLAIPFRAPTEHVLVRASVIENIETETGIEKIASSVINAGFTFDKEDNKYAPEIYTLSSATVMSFWKDRVFLAGVKEDRNVLFASRTNAANYFPYPNNVEFFDEPIVDMVPFLEDLLVFTTSKLYQLTLTADGMSWTKVCLQEHLQIAPWDRHLTQIVKNMVFFKSGNYYYMVVPKATSTTGGLTLAPITKSIKEFLDGFKENVTEILEEVYDFREPLKLIHYYNFLDYEFIHNMYVFKNVAGLYINVDLMYNSVKRYWKLHIYETENFLFPLQQHATRQGELISLCVRKHLAGTVPVTTYAHIPFIQYLTHDEANHEDKVYSKVWGSSTPSRSGAHKFKNYQFLDTGYREHNTELKKRYRELQFRIENSQMRDLHFYSGFYIDGNTRKSYYTFEPEYVAETQELFMAKHPVDPMFMQGNTVLNHWSLGLSEFPTTKIWKVRVPVSGKGYCPRIKLVSYNEAPFKLHNMSWVYRQLYSR